MTREEMMDEVIKTMGFEDERTISFCRLAEDMTEEELRVVFNLLMED